VPAFIFLDCSFFSFCDLTTPSGLYTHCAVCLIKPHAVSEKAAGKIIDMILGANGSGSSSSDMMSASGGFGESGHLDRSGYGGAGGSSKFGRMEISAARSIVLSAEDAKDYLEPYRTVCPEYERWVVELSSGPAIVLEVRGEEIVPALRDLAGPYDPEIAKALRPSTIRARFGINSVKNAVHVTDVDVDGPLESKFMFMVLNE
jgi:nucleoside diphosphate kinase